MRQCIAAYLQRELPWADSSLPLAKAILDIRKANDNNSIIQADMDLAVQYLYTGKPVSARDKLDHYR